MKDPNIVLANDKNGADITVKQVEDWLKNKSKKELADFFYDRYYGRYLKPFDFKNDEYCKNYKSGFAIMTSCCLLIETFVSYTESVFKDTKNKSERCFGYFFLTNSEFNAFSKNGLTIHEYTDLSRTILNNKGIPRDFYRNFRCGLLHNGETRNGWKISRNGDLFDEVTKRINAVKFHDILIDVLIKFREKLKVSDFDNDNIWKAYIGRLQDLINKS